MTCTDYLPVRWEIWEHRKNLHFSLTEHIQNLDLVFEH